MIYAWTGKTGSSKTFRMVRAAYPRWLRGETIYSNTKLFFEATKVQRVFDFLWSLGPRLVFLALRKAYVPPKRGKIIYFEDISEILDAYNGTILFDEAQVLFSSRQWESLPMEFQYKLQQHRKHELDLFCTTQNMAAIDITYRRLVHVWIHCERFMAIGENPVWLGIFREKHKDVDYLYNSVDDLATPEKETIFKNPKIKYFIIWRFSRRLYDTMYDIGFRRFKVLWMMTKQSTSHLKATWMIIPKNVQLSSVPRALSLLKTLNYGQKRSSSSRKT